MHTGAATDDIPNDNDALVVRDDLRGTVDEALASSPAGLHLAPSLEHLFWRSADPIQQGQVCRRLAGLAAIHAACTLIDWSTVPQLTITAAYVRWCFCVPLLLASAWLLASRAPNWAKEVATIAPLPLQTAATVFLGKLSPEPYADRYFMAAGIGIALINLFFSLRFRQALTQTLLSVGIYAAMLFYDSGNHATESVGDLALFTIIIAVGSLVSVRELEISNKRIFLLRTRDEMRTEELQRANEQLLAISLRDALTGVGNRRSFDLALEQAWSAAAQGKGELGLLMVDADSFKDYNDTLGHAEGDQCLKAIAQALQNSIRGTGDRVARYGGEEFAVLLMNTSVPAAEAIAERMRQAIEQLHIPHPASKKCQFVTVSIGVATLRPKVKDPDPSVLVQAADWALYEAKHAGRNRVMVSAVNKSRPQHVGSSTLH